MWAGRGLAYGLPPGRDLPPGYVIPGKPNQNILKPYGSGARNLLWESVGFLEKLLTSIAQKISSEENIVTPIGFAPLYTTFSHSDQVLQVVSEHLNVPKSHLKPVALSR